MKAHIKAHTTQIHCWIFCGQDYVRVFLTKDKQKKKKTLHRDVLGFLTGKSLSLFSLHVYESANKNTPPSPPSPFLSLFFSPQRKEAEFADPQQRQTSPGSAFAAPYSREPTSHKCSAAKLSIHSFLFLPRFSGKWQRMWLDFLSTVRKLLYLISHVVNENRKTMLSSINQKERKRKERKNKEKNKKKTKKRDYIDRIILQSQFVCRFLKTGKSFIPNLISKQTQQGGSTTYLSTSLVGHTATMSSFCLWQHVDIYPKSILATW